MPTEAELLGIRYRRRSEIPIEHPIDYSKLGNSQTSQKILKHFTAMFNEGSAKIGCAKCLPFPSCKIKGPGTSIFHVGTPRSFKSALTNEITTNIFSEEFYIDLKSDFTANSLKAYIDKIKEGRVFVTNDAALLLDSKAYRTKKRLEGSLAELVSDGVYEYQDFKQKFRLEGNVRLLFNMTFESYQKNKKSIFVSTLSDRMVTLFHLPSETQKENWIFKQENTEQIKFSPKITVNDIETEIKPIPSHLLKLIKLEARKLSYLMLRSFISAQDLMKGTVRAHASLNNRKNVCSDDFYFLFLIKPYFVNPFNLDEIRIIQLRAKGMGYGAICKAIGWSNNCRQQVKRIIIRNKMRGILPLENKNEK